MTIEKLFERLAWIPKDARVFNTSVGLQIEWVDSTKTPSHQICALIVPEWENAFRGVGAGNAVSRFGRRVLERLGH